MYSTVFILLLPLGLALTAFFLNKKKEESALRWNLNKHQLYNLEVLKTFLNANKDRFSRKSKEQIKKEITPHGWDPAIVEVASEDFLRSPDGSTI